jgi:hypothetical protein
VKSEKWSTNRLVTMLFNPPQAEDFTLVIRLFNNTTLGAAKD